MVGGRRSHCCSRAFTKRLGKLPANYNARSQPLSRDLGITNLVGGDNTIQGSVLAPESMSVFTDIGLHAICKKNQSVCRHSVVYPYAFKVGTVFLLALKSQ